MKIKLSNLVKGLMISIVVISMTSCPQIVNAKHRRYHYRTYRTYHRRARYPRYRRYHKRHRTKRYKRYRPRRYHQRTYRKHSHYRHARRHYSKRNSSIRTARHSKNYYSISNADNYQPEGVTNSYLSPSRDFPISHKLIRYNERQACSQALKDVNADRASVGVSPLSKSDILQNIAKIRSKQIISKWTHYDSKGGAASQDVAKQLGYNPTYFALENLGGYGGSYTNTMTGQKYTETGPDAANGVNELEFYGEKAAPGSHGGDMGHRQTIEDPTYDSIGIGCTYNYKNDEYCIAYEFGYAQPGNSATNTTQNSNGTTTHYRNGGYDYEGNDGSYIHDSGVKPA